VPTTIRLEINQPRKSTDFASNFGGTGETVVSSQYSVVAAQKETEMRHLVRSAAGSIATLAIVSCATTGAALACPVGGYDCKPTEWRTSYWRGGYDFAEAVRQRVINPEVLDAVLGRYPYRTYGYNNGTCIAYRVICDQEGHVIGEEPVLTC
jgi:hypothetical protein